MGGSSFHGIELAKRSLFAHNKALTTVGHNLANASTEGYSRQRVHFQSTEPLYRADLSREETPGQIGQGVDVARIERVRDELLDGRIVASASGESYWQTRDSYVKQMEQIYNEPGDLSLRSRMDQFWASWQEVANFPEQMASRQVVLEKGQSLADGIRLRNQQLEQVRSVLNEDIAVQVNKVNDLASQIALVNRDIERVESEGDQPNDLYDRRDLLVDDLSKIINITVDRRDPDEFTIHTEGLTLVQGGLKRSFKLETDQQNEGNSRIVWADTGNQAEFAGGKLGALVELRDQDVRREIQSLDNMAVNFTDLVNEVHQAGYGLNGSTGNKFFVEYPFVTNGQGNFDRNGDGQFDHSYVFRLSGTNQLEAQTQIGLKGTLKLDAPQGTVDVDYFPTDTVEDLILRINLSGSNVVARLDRENRLSLKAAPGSTLDQPDFVIRHVEDSGQFLTGYAGLLKASGADGAYRYDTVDAVRQLRSTAGFAVAPVAHPSAWMGINEELRKDPGSLAASLGVADRKAEIGDGRAALEIADLRQRPVMVGLSGTFDDYFADSIAGIGIKGQEAQIASRTHELIMKNLRDAREGYSGVNMDEELAEMMKFQHGYNAAARFVSEVDKMLDVVINRMGV